jgi:ribosomal protein L23
MIVILRPLINEKSMALTKTGLYTFEISRTVNKQQVEQMIKNKFGVDVLHVKTVTTQGKTKVQASRKGFFRTAPTKKAIVQLKAGQKIALFEVAEPDKEEVEVRTAEGEVIAKSKEKKGLFGGPKVKIEKVAEETKLGEESAEMEHPEHRKEVVRTGKTKGGK